MTIFHKHPPSWWTKDVQAMTAGTRVRTGDSYLISFNGIGWFRWDFREKQGEVYEPQLTLAQRLQYRKQLAEAEDRAARSIEPPVPALKVPRDWPVEARMWLYKAGMTNDDIRDMGAYWHPHMRRVVVPFVDVKGVASWRARNVGLTDGPKYMGPANHETYGALVWHPTGAAMSGIVLTEDYLSAWRVARADPTLMAVALMGTTADRPLLSAVAAEAVQHRLPALLWLDADKYGKSGNNETARMLTLLGASARIMRETREPKHFVTDEALRLTLESSWQR